MRTLLAVVLLSVLTLSALAQTAASGQPDPNKPTEISADQGSCSALITVTDAASKGIYNAKVTARVRYGFMGTKKLDLETYTNVNGQVKFVGLPEVPKKPIYFYVSKDSLVEIVEFKPETSCQAKFDVKLK